MKTIIYICCILLTIASCKTKHQSTQKVIENEVVNDTIRISGDNLEYDIIIIDTGYNSWLATAKPKGFYSQNYLENKNIQYVTAWNNRVLNLNFDQNLYEMQINYQQGIDYGYDVNYQLYNYFVFFQNKYNQNLTGGRIPQN